MRNILRPIIISVLAAVCFGSCRKGGEERLSFSVDVRILPETRSILIDVTKNGGSDGVCVVRPEIFVINPSGGEMIRIATSLLYEGRNATGAEIEFLDGQTRTFSAENLVTGHYILYMPFLMKDFSACTIETDLVVPEGFDGGGSIEPTPEPEAVPAPSGVTFAGSDASSVRFTWIAVTGLSDTPVYECCLFKDDQKVGEKTVTANEASFTGLAPLTEYGFVVRATVGDNAGPWAERVRGYTTNLPQDK